MIKLPLFLLFGCIVFAKTVALFCKRSSSLSWFFRTQLPARTFDASNVLNVYLTPANVACFSLQTLLQTALDVEVKQLKEDLRVKRALDDMFPKAADAPTQVKI